MKRRALILLLLACCLACVSWAQSLVAYRTHFTHGYYSEPGSLSEHLWTNYEARIVGRQPLVISNITMVDWTAAHSAVWNTNWYFYGMGNFTAQSHVRTNDSGGWWTWRKSTVLSRVLILQAGHTHCYENTTGLCGSNYWHLFLDATNGQHWRRIIYGLSRNSVTNGDIWLGVLDSPLPTNIGTMKIVEWATLTNKLTHPDKIPILFNSQHSRTEAAAEFTPQPGTGFWDTNTTLFTSVGNVWSYGSPGLPKTIYLSNTNPAYGTQFTNVGFDTDNVLMGSVMDQDSGSPTYIVVSNRLCFVPYGIQAPRPGYTSNFMTDVNTATVAGGYTTNDYPVEFETLSQFPDL